MLYMVYDNRDRLTFIQDANQRLSRQWLFTKYDDINRPVLTGIYTADFTLEQGKMQRRVNNFYSNLTPGRAWFETYKGNIPGNIHGYDNKPYTFTVIPGERFKIRVKGYTTGANNAYLQVKVGNTTLNTPGVILPNSAATESWVEQTVTIPLNTTTLRAGVVWTTLTAGQVINLNEFEITKLETIDPEYQYHLKDHLGNVRVTFTTKITPWQQTAGFEPANQNNEAANFQNYPSGGEISSIPENAQTGTSAYLLNGGYSGQVGLAKSFAVMPGDQVQIEAYAKYTTPSGTPSNYNNFVASLLSAFSLSAPAPGELGTASSAISAFGNWEIGGSGHISQSDPVKVFVTIVLFDKDYNFLDAAYHASLSSGSLMSKSYTVKEPGYAYLYISNEHPGLVDVYFDDVTVTHTPSPLIQVDDYYPFGLMFNSYNRENVVPNKFKFQSQEHIDDLNLGWDSFKWRNHQPGLGRFFNIDPLAEKYVYNSPYAFSENKVVAHRELEGLESESVNKRQTDKQKKATDKELQRRSEGKTPNLNVIPKENTTNTNAKSNTTGGNFQSGEKQEKSAPAPREDFAASRPLDIVPFDYGGSAQSAEQNIFNGSTDIPAGGVVESATLNINIEVTEGGNSQTMTVQQGNFGLDGQRAQGPTLLDVSIQDIKGSFSKSIPLNNINHNTNLSVQFSGGGNNKVNVTGVIIISGTKPKKP